MEGSTPGTKICACALGVSLGIVTALAMVIMGVAAWHFKVGEAWVTLASSVYVGFAATPKGILIGAIWGFVEGFVTGFILGWIYNAVVKVCPCKGCKSSA